MHEKLAKLCATSFKQNNYMLIFDDFEQNLEGADQGQPGPLLPEAAELVKVLLHYLAFSGKMTQLIVTTRYQFSLSEQNRNLVKEQLEPISLTSFQPAEQRKKARELKNILIYGESWVAHQLVAAGRGNPRLMEWLDILVGQMPEPEVPRLLEVVKEKQEEFIRKHVMRELVQQGGKELERFLPWFAVYRRPVLIEGVHQVGENAGLEKCRELLMRGLELSLVEYDRARKSYSIIPLLRDELLTGIDNLHPCHQAAFNYYKQVCEPMERLDPLLVEEWIFHALGCGEEDTASEKGCRLVDHLRDRLAFMESRRVGEWVLEEKKLELATDYDAFLLNSLAYTINELGDYRKAIKYYEQALATWKESYGEKHQHIATALSNLGAAYFDMEQKEKAISN
jgi:tetratricopeptide (TPR) repeat protein